MNRVDVTYSPLRRSLQVIHAKFGFPCSFMDYTNIHMMFSFYYIFQEITFFVP